jgi:hypothetical protein
MQEELKTRQLQHNFKTVTRRNSRSSQDNTRHNKMKDKVEGKDEDKYWAKAGYRHCRILTLSLLVDLDFLSVVSVCLVGFAFCKGFQLLVLAGDLILVSRRSKPGTSLCSSMANHYHYSNNYLYPLET